MEGKLQIYIYNLIDFTYGGTSKDKVIDFKSKKLDELL